MYYLLYITFLFRNIYFTKNTWYDWYDWLINYIPEPIKKSVSGFWDQIMNLFKTTNYSKPERVKTVYGRGKKKFEEKLMKSIRNLFKLKKENEAIKYIIIRDIENLFKEGDDYYKQTRVGNFWNKNYIKCTSSGDRNKNISVREYLDKIKPYLKNIIINPQKSDAWNIQLTIAINFSSS